MSIDNKSDWAYSYLIYFTSLSFILTSTVFASKALFYASILILLFSFLQKCKSFGYGIIPLSCKLWVPFIGLTILNYAAYASLEKTVYWMVALIILLSSSKDMAAFKIPYKTIFYVGIFAVIGILFQFFLTDRYNAIIFSKFSSESINFFENGGGLQGFTPQTGTTASLLLLGEASLLYALSIKKKFVYYTVLALFIIAILMTGKRTMAIIAVLIPLLLLIIQSKVSLRKVLLFSSLFIAIYMFVVYFINNLDAMTENILFKRLAISIADYQTGDEILSGRELLYEKAWEGFVSNPLLGIGVGQFRYWSGFETAVHNMYLQVLCEQGFIGFTFLIIPLISCIVFTIRLIRKENAYRKKNLLLFSLFNQLVFVMYGFTGNPTVNVSGFLMYFMAIGIMENMNNEVS